MQGWVAATIRKFVFNVPFGQMFSTRDCLNFGRRSAVDQELYRLVKRGDIVRLARGVFIKLKWGMDRPSPFEVANFKAKAFGRRGAAMPEPGLTNLAMEADRKVLPLATDGASSSFGTAKQRVRLIGRAPRKVWLGDSMHGLAIRMLWETGEGNVTHELANRVMAPLGRSETALLRRSCHIMPAWLADILVWSRQPKSTRIA